jgi:hypothetical protein
VFFYFTLPKEEEENFTIKWYKHFNILSILRCNESNSRIGIKMNKQNLTVGIRVLTLHPLVETCQDPFIQIAWRCTPLIPAQS